MKFTNDQAIAKMESVILRYIQPPTMTPLQNADYLHAKSCKVANDYRESTLNDIFIADVNYFICQSPRNYWASNLQANLTNVGFNAQSILAIQK